jgi:hypothetical protein
VLNLSGKQSDKSISPRIVCRRHHWRSVELSGSEQLTEAGLALGGVLRFATPLTASRLSHHEAGNQPQTKNAQTIPCLCSGGPILEVYDYNVADVVGILGSLHHGPHANGVTTVWAQVC